MAKLPTTEIPHPRENPSLIGHAALEADFIREFEVGRTHHAYLITGPKGIGKATLAYRLARHVLCQGALTKAQEAPSMSLFGEEPAPAPAAASDMSADDPLFRRIAAGSHTDLLTVSPAYDAKKGVEKDTITVDDARKVPDFLSLTPAEGDWRVVIVDAVDQLNANAANALLKILEEPPPRALLFLICHAPGGILPTIRSRCRQLRMAPPDARAFAAILDTIAPDIPNHDYAALGALSHGSPGHAITLFGEGAIGWYESWLSAMHPAAAPQARQKLADSAAAQKSPNGWDTVIHCWHTAIERLTLYRQAPQTEIFRGEAAALAAIATSFGPHTCRRWAEEGARLIHQTETFNLDKRQTIRLLTDPVQLDVLAA